MECSVTLTEWCSYLGVNTFLCQITPTIVFKCSTRMENSSRNGDHRDRVQVNSAPPLEFPSILSLIKSSWLTLEIKEFNYLAEIAWSLYRNQKTIKVLSCVLSLTFTFLYHSYKDIRIQFLDCWYHSITPICLCCGCWQINTFQILILMHPLRYKCQVFRKKIDVKQACTVMTLVQYLQPKLICECFIVSLS